MLAGLRACGNLRQRIAHGATALVVLGAVSRPDGYVDMALFGNAAERPDRFVASRKPQVPQARYPGQGGGAFSSPIKQAALARQRKGWAAVLPLHGMGFPPLPTACVKLDALRLMTMPSAQF